MQETSITYPTLFPIKMLGLATDTFEGAVIAILNQHVPDLGEGSIQSALSTQGKYVSITATINATSQAQLDGLYQALSRDPAILMVL